MNKKLPIILAAILIPAIIIILLIVFYPTISNLLNLEGETNAEPKVLSMWGLYENPQAYNEIAQSYTELNPNITLSYDDRSLLSPQEHKERLFSRLSSGSSDQDIVLVHNTWVQELAPYLSTMPASILSTQEYQSNFYPSASQSALINNNIYAVPAFYDGLVLVYNRDHFEEVDQLQAPTTWEEFRRLAIDLTIRGTGDTIVRSGAAIGNANNIDFASDILGLLFSQTDVVIPDTIDSRAAQDALSFYTSFTKEYEIWNDDFIEASSAFTQGQVSMIFVPTWNILDIIQANPSLNIGVAPVPQAIADDPVSWGSFWMYAVPQSSNNTQDAWEFINYISQEPQQKVLNSIASRYRQYAAPYALRSLAVEPEITQNSYVQPALEYADNSVSGIIASRAGNINEESIIRDTINTVLNTTSQNLSLPDLLRAAKNQLLR